MKPGKLIGRTAFALLVAGLLLAFAASMRAQDVSETATTKGQATRQVSVERGEVVYVSGNDLVVKMADGTIRHFANVPDSARADVDGKMLSIHQLEPGMKLERTITTTTVPKLVTTTRTIKGTVFFVSPPNSVILTLPDGKNQRYRIPKGQKFDIGGQMTDAFGLRKGMNITATVVTEVPETQVAVNRQVTGQMPPPPPPPPDVPILVVFEEPAPAPAPEPAVAEAEPAALPHTASPVPLVGLLGLLSLGLGIGLVSIRKFV
jgi:hypothetical protein